MGTQFEVTCHDQQLHIQDFVKWVFGKLTKEKHL